MSDVDVNDISHDDSSFDEGAVVSDLPDWFRCKRKWRHQKICSLAEANLIINDMPLDNPGNAWKFICKTHMSDLAKNFLGPSTPARSQFYKSFFWSNLANLSQLSYSIFLRSYENAKIYAGILAWA